MSSWRCSFTSLREGHLKKSMECFPFCVFSRFCGFVISIAWKCSDNQLLPLCSGQWTGWRFFQGQMLGRAFDNEGMDIAVWFTNIIKLHDNPNSSRNTGVTRCCFLNGSSWSTPINRCAMFQGDCGRLFFKNKCPFYHVPDYGGFITWKACIRRFMAY